MLGSLVPAGTFYPPTIDNVNHSSPLESKGLVSHPESKKSSNTGCSPRGMRNILHPSYQKCPHIVTIYNNVSSVYHDKTYAPDEISSRSEDNGFTSESAPTKSNNNTSTDSFGSDDSSPTVSNNNTSCDGGFTSDDSTPVGPNVNTNTDDDFGSDDSSPTTSNNGTDSASFGSESINDTGKSEQSSDFDNVKLVDGTFH